MVSRTTETALEITVAMATPSTDMPKHSTKRRFNTTFSNPVQVKMNSGVRVSPCARRIEIMKFASARNGVPIK